ncbi:hypothetical protein [Phenylobacterium montanum]|uniref:Uncharacterized protein n=1 Tax=Phenylobacterium montanum TaxID=2823693 RepID=A0A975G0M2_9CAUL|nr:hypothetical protein [Caulobacter sp. S6]QUD88933.1 hypothetical protein KCG34_03320 [Caulobacter sp. S6]
MLRSSVQNRPPATPIGRFADTMLWPIRRFTDSDVDAATIKRVFRSKHVTDLQLIMAFAILFGVLALVIGAPLSLAYQHVELLTADHAPLAPLKFGDRSLMAAKDFLTFFGPILAGVGAVVAWAYQTASARLGVVDLFACEISTLCRVVAVVDTVRHRVAEFQAGAPAAKPGHDEAHAFTSQESYFPVFEANSNELQSLEAKVVIHITAFYSYIKATRDSGRGLAAATPSDEDRTPFAQGLALGPWRTALRTLIYMLFLGLESGRKSIHHLVEFEPEEAERILVILISEIEAYHFLRQQYPDATDMHHQRIILREADYRREVPILIDQVDRSYRVAESAAKAADSFGDKAGLENALRKLMNWEAAERLLPEVWRRYEAAGLSTGARHTLLDLPGAGKAACFDVADAARRQIAEQPEA